MSMGMKKKKKKNKLYVDGYVANVGYENCIYCRKARKMRRTLADLVLP